MASIELKRANKITAYWEGDGVAAGIFYKTHDKLATVKSNEELVVSLGFVFPEGTDEEPVTASQKLESYKAFLASNASAFGIAYDPIDRRADAFKFPGKYTDATFGEFAVKILETAIMNVVDSVNNNVIDKMIKNEHLPIGSTLQYGIGEPQINVSEKYNNGNLKYATATIPSAFQVNDKRMDVNIEVDLVSGQLKKPRNIGDVVMTMTGVKGMLIENGLLPKIEPAKKEEPTDAVEGAEVPSDAVAQ